MRNPLRSEAEAFRFVVVVIVGAVVIVAAAYINTWVGVAAAVVVVGAISWWLLRAPSGEPPAPRLSSRTPDDMHRILVLANETVGGGRLREQVRRHTPGDRPTEFLIVSPALNSPVRHWVS